MTVAWLQDLEERVRQAVTELGKLRAENAELTKRIAELELLEEQGGGEREWEAERSEIRQRVEELTSNLESLLDG